MNYDREQDILALLVKNEGKKMIKIRKAKIALAN